MAACVAAGDDPGTQEIYDSIAHYMEIFSDDLTDGGRAAWQALQSALSSWTAAGDGTVYESGGLSLWVPEGWADMAVVTAEDGHRPVNSDQKRERPEFRPLFSALTGPGTPGSGP